MFQADKNGKPLGMYYHHIYENIMLEGDVYRKLILIEGKPPDAKLQKKIDAEMEKERADRRAHPEYHHSSNTIHYGDTATLDRLFDNKVVGEEVVSGRKTWRIESEPKADRKPANQEENEFMAWLCTTWYDQQEGMLLKSLHILIHAMNIYRPGTEMEMEWGKHGDAWLLERQNHPYSMKAVLNRRKSRRNPLPVLRLQEIRGRKQDCGVDRRIEVARGLGCLPVDPQRCKLACHSSER